MNQTRLTALGLSFSDIQNSVTAANVNAAKGSFDGTDLSYVINTNDQLLSAKDYSRIIVAYKNNSPIRLSDIANVIDDVENTKQAAWVNKTPAIIINIQRQPGANVIKVADSIKDLLPHLSSTLPKSIEISIISDRTNTIRASISDVTFELLFSIILVIIVIFIFLGTFTATIIPAIAIPLSLIGSFAFIYFLGFSINNLTLMALTIATGFVIDDAIVMLENISRYIEQGMTPLEAAFKGSKQIGFTILSLTISLIAVLIPLFFMQDVIGRLFREFAITLTCTILISAFISLTLTPMLCSRILKSAKSRQVSKFEIIAENVLKQIINYYSKSLQIVFNHQQLTLITLLITIIITGILFYNTPKGFFHQQDTGIIQGVSLADQTISFDKMAVKQQQLVNSILEDKSIDNLLSFIGIDGINTTLNQGRIVINLKPLNKRNNISKIIDGIQSRLDKVDSIKLYLQPVADLSVDNSVSIAQYQYSLTSQDHQELSSWSSKLITELNKLPQLHNVNSNQLDNGLQVFLDIDRDRASVLGITMEMISDTLYSIFGQRQISTIFSQRNQYHVILEGVPSISQGIAALDNIYIISNSGKPVALKIFSKISVTNAPLTINRTNQFPAVTISFDLAKNISLGTAVKAIDKAVQKVAMPNYIQGNFQGTAQIFKNSLNNEGWLILAAVVVVYIVLGVLYESYIHPITIISTLPSACMGALLALLITNKDLDVIAIIGIILLIGIVKKNAIMMIDFALEQQRIYKKPPTEAIFEACILRFRPIMMTTVASMFGAIPFIISSGMGSELRQPLGITIMGGLTISQLLTLYTTPVVYLFFDKLSQKYNINIGGE